MMFEEQVTTDVYLSGLVYAVGILAVMLAVTGLTILDIGLVRRKNVVDTVVQKLGAGMVAAVGFAPIGYGVWLWQYYDAFAIPEPLRQAVEDWWIGGKMVNTLPQLLDPAEAALADTFQVFFVFFVAFAIFMGAVIHTIGVERMKPLPLFALCFVAGAAILPLTTALMWGSTGLLSNLGVHDHVGGFAVYVPLGAIALVLAWRLGPRIGMFDDRGGDDRPGPTNVPLVAVGVVLVLAALPFFAVGGGYLVPGSGYFGISMTTSGFGMVLLNLFATIVGGGFGGMLLSYATRESYWVIGGPFVGYVSGTTFFDVGRPWYMFLIAAGAPVVAMLSYRAMKAVRLDEEKVVPLVLGPAIYGALVGGFTEWNERMGGYFGIEEGEFVFQHAEVTPLWQLVGIGASFGIAAAITLVVCLVMERITGLRVSEDEEIAGLDAKYWDDAHHAGPHGSGDDVAGVAPPTGAVPQRV